MGTTMATILDIPAIRDQDNAAGYYIAAYGTSDEWAGCSVYRSLDDGASYDVLTDVKNAAVVGSAVGVLASGTPDAWDNTHTVQVVVKGQLESYAEASAPLMLIGNEIVRCRDATLVSSRGIMTTYTLSGLLRGIKGTSAEVGTHLAGDRVVLLNSSVARISDNFENIGKSQLIKAVSFGTALADAITISFVNSGKSLPVFATGASHTVDEMITFLQSIGLCKQS